MKKIIFITTIFLVLLGGNSASAASLLIDQENSLPKTGDELLLTVSMNTEGESYNTVSGVLTLDRSLELRQIITGASVISAWLENPQNTKSNTIHFSGIIAGGLSGTGTLFQIIAVPKSAGTAQLTADTISFFRNDGTGSEEYIQPASLTLSIQNLAPGETNKKIKLLDTIPPELFEVILTQDKNIANNNHILIFNAIDKGSGIKTYSVLEGRKLFEHATSPYVLKNQRINEKIYVKAIDYEHNERVVAVRIPNKTCLVTYCIPNQSIVILFGILCIISFFIWRKQSTIFKKISNYS